VEKLVTSLCAKPLVLESREEPSLATWIRALLERRYPPLLRELHRYQHCFQFQIRVPAESRCAGHAFRCAPPFETDRATEGRWQAQTGPRFILPEKLVHSLNLAHLLYLTRITAENPLLRYRPAIAQLLKGQDDLP
jgi:hypothetical protein